MDLLSRLPRDIVFHHIINNLDFTTRVRAAAVSHAWRDLVRATPHTAADLSLCWLWDGSDLRTDHNPFLVNLASLTYFGANRYNRPSHREHVIGSSGLYLSFKDDSSRKRRRVGDPFTGETCPLPCAYVDGDGLAQPVQIIYRMRFSSSLPNCVMAAEILQGLYVCRAGDSMWVELGVGSTLYISDMIFHKGLLYLLNHHSKSITAYDVVAYMTDYHNGRSPFSTTPICHRIASADIDYCSLKRGGGWRRSLVECDGELLIVTSVDNRSRKWMDFMVHRVDEENQRLVRVEDLGGRMLFTDFGCSILSKVGRGPMSTTSDDFFTENSIYFLTENPHCCLELFDDSDKNLFRLGKYRLDSKTYTYHPIYGFKYRSIWV